MDNPKKILILTADAGFGHRSAANAVAEALIELYGSQVVTEIVNPLDDKRTPIFLRQSQYDYGRWVKSVPELYELGYNASDAIVPTRILEQSLSIMLLDVMREVLVTSKPDVILSTYPLYQSALTTLFTTKRKHVPLYTVITDLSTIHRLWFHRKVDGCLVPNNLAAELAASYGIPPAKITITGIPVSPLISKDTRPKDEIRKELGWQVGIPTFLAVGSKRVERLVDALNVINHFGASLQVVVVAGKDESLYEKAMQMEWHIPAHIYNYVENMPTLMNASDLIISKAGGLIVTESLASGLPMILIEVIPGQETGNAEYVTAFGAADMAQSPIEILEVISHLMANNHALLKERANNALQLSQPKSAYAVAKVLWNAAVNGIQIKRSSLRNPSSNE